MKTCTKCGETKALDEFYVDRRNNRSYARCKTCHKAYSRGAKYRARQKSYYEENRERVLAGHKRYRNGAGKAVRQEHGRANRAAINARQRDYRERNKERIREYDREYYALDYARNRDRYDKRNARRKARKAAVEHQPYTRQEIYDRDEGKCQACSKALPFAPRAFHIDHIVPLALNGPDIPSNIQVLCPTCNCSKRHDLEGQIRFAA